MDLHVVTYTASWFMLVECISSYSFLYSWARPMSPVDISLQTEKDMKDLEGKRLPLNLKHEKCCVLILLYYYSAVLACSTHHLHIVI